MVTLHGILTSIWQAWSEGVEGGGGAGKKKNLTSDLISKVKSFSGLKLGGNLYSNSDERCMPNKLLPPDTQTMI